MLSFLARTLEADFGFLFLYSFKIKELDLVVNHSLPLGLQEAWTRLGEVPACGL